MKDKKMHWLIGESHELAKHWSSKNNSDTHNEGYSCDRMAEDSFRQSIDPMSRDQTTWREHGATLATLGLGRAVLKSGIMIATALLVIADVIRRAHLEPGDE